MRIVSLLPAATEIACALGLRDSLVGRSHECDVPEDVVDLPILTRSRLPDALGSAAIHDAVREALSSDRSLFELDECLLESLRPDLVITQDACAVCAIAYEDVDRLARRCSPAARVLSLAPTRLAHVLEDIERVAAASGVPERGRKLASDLRGRLAALATDRRTERVAILEWLAPPMLAGHWAPDLVDAAGAISIGPRPGGPSEVTTWDAVKALGLDALVVAPCGFSLSRVMSEAAGLHETLQEVVPRVLFLDGSREVNRPGPKLIDTAESLSHWLRTGRDAPTGRSKKESR